MSGKESKKEDEMPTIWDKFIEKYHHDLIYLALPVILEAFWYYSHVGLKRSAAVKKCEAVLGIHS